MYKKKCIMIIMMIIVIALGFSKYNYNQKNNQRIIKKDFNEFYDSFASIAQYLSDYDYPIIYAKRDNIISDNREQTINSMVSMELFNEPHTICVEKLGYHEFIKDSGIYFIKNANIFGEVGIMFYPSGFKKEYDVLVTTFEELSNGWYYYQKSN